MARHGCAVRSLRSTVMDCSACTWTRLCRHLAPARCRTCRLSFPKFFARILDALHANGGEMKRRDVLRLLGRKQRYGIELERALAQLKKEERINFLERSPATGGTTYTVTPIPISFLDRRYDNSWNATVRAGLFWGFGAIALKSSVQRIPRLAQALDRRHAVEG